MPLDGAAPTALEGPAPPALQRARGRAEVAFRAGPEGRTRLERLFQEGQAKIRLPAVHGGPPVAVLINTAGGVTGGDRLAYAATWGAGARATVTAQAAERIYRSTGEAGHIDVALTVGPGAEAEWLPQETILFDRGRIRRRLEVDLAADASLLMVETVVFGRGAMGERVRGGEIVDHWRIRRDGRLLFADSLRVTGDSVSVLAGAATGAGATALSTVVLVAPDAAGRLDAVREVLQAGPGAVESGASALDRLLVIRFLSLSAQALRAELVRVLEALRGRPLPRVWSC
ncbi:urease accessory protein UreD [Prosthecomicrobium sp. N25]|uniref:urease accessory protein UreD n=1 Tax=Prosthecomicrobium sp. N25 TaxID=3129254 RepID=UPI00307733BB